MKYVKLILKVVSIFDVDDRCLAQISLQVSLITATKLPNSYHHDDLIEFENPGKSQVY